MRFMGNGAKESIESMDITSGTFILLKGRVKVFFYVNVPAAIK